MTTLQSIQQDIKTLFKLYRKVKCKNCIENISFMENNKVDTGFKWTNGKKIYVKVYTNTINTLSGVPNGSFVPTNENIDEILPMSKSSVKINVLGEDRYYEAEGVLKEASELPTEYNLIYIQPNNIVYNIKNGNDTVITAISVVYFTEL